MIRVGTVVVIARASAINRAGEIGVVYEHYGRGVSIVFENGGYDGFSEEDLKIFEVHQLGLYEPLSQYRFVNVMRVSDDHRRGIFKPAFRFGQEELDRRAAGKGAS